MCVPLVLDSAVRTAPQLISYNEMSWGSEGCEWKPNTRKQNLKDKAKMLKFSFKGIDTVLQENKKTLK